MTRPLIGVPIEGQPEGVVSRMALYGEARGEKSIGAAAVWFVARNRAVKHVTDIKAQWLLPLQFSCFNHDDPNRERLLDAHRTHPAEWERACAVCDLCESTFVTDPTHGATHYYNPAVCDPEWGRRHPGWRELAVIGNHCFGVSA